MYESYIEGEREKSAIHILITDFLCPNRDIVKNTLSRRPSPARPRPFLEERIYSVTQSYVNSFGGYVVLDTFNNVSRDEDNILDKIYIKQCARTFIMKV